MSKLTLSIDSKIIGKAKRYLQTDKDSLSGLVEKYFSMLIEVNEGKKTRTPITESLLGIVKGKDIDEREVIVDYLLEKYK